MTALTARRQAANTSFDPAGTTLTSTNVQDAIEEILVSGTAPALIHPTRVIRNGVDGVVSGTLNETDATVNRTQINNIISAAATAKAWIEPDGATFNIGGGPINIPNGAKWKGQFATTIAQRTNNVAIVQIGATGAGAISSNIEFDGASLFYGADQAGNTSAVSLLLGNMWQSDIRNVRCCNTTSTNRPYINIKIPQGVSFFSNTLTNIYAIQAYYSNLWRENFGTGNTYRDIYLSCVGPAGTAQICSFPYRLDVNSQQVHGDNHDQLNLEWHITNQLMRFNNARSLNFNSLHIEQNQLSGAGASYIYNALSNVNINGLMFLDNWIRNATVSDTIPAIFKCFNDGMTNVNGFTHNNNSGSYIDKAYYLAYQDLNDGYNSNPSIVTINHPQFVDAAGTSIQTYMRPDRSLGGTDFDSVVWPSQIYVRARSMVLNNVLPTVENGVIRLTGTPTSSRLYGQVIGRRLMVQVSGTLGATSEVILDNFMAPTGARWASAPVPDGTVVEFRRAGTHVNDFNIKRHDGTTLVTMPNGSGTSRRYAVKVAGDWTAT
jgi:hypothetical protein